LIRPSANDSRPSPRHRLLGADRPHLQRHDPRGDLVAEPEALDLRARLELVQTRLVTEHRAAELVAERVALPVVVAVGEHDAPRPTVLAEPLDALGGSIGSISVPEPAT
jgi:hypothetical protein